MARQRLVKASSEFSERLICHPGLFQAIGAALDRTNRWHQRECVLTGPVVMLAVLLLSLERSLSIGRVLNRALTALRRADEDVPLRSVTPEALCHARSRLGAEPLQALFEMGAAKVRPDPSFHGLRVWIFDTMDARVPDTPANVDAFGRPGVAKGRAGFPQIGASVLLDAAGRRVRGLYLAEPTESERDAAVHLAQLLGPGDLLLQDSGLAGVWVSECYARRGIHYLVRIPDGWKPKIIKTLARGDYLVELTGIRPVWLRETVDDFLNPRIITLRARMIISKVPGHKPVRLLTSLLDSKALRPRELAFLYHVRWDIEMAFDEIKTHFAAVLHGTMKTTFRSKTPDGVMQEAYGLFAAYNFVRELIQVAAERHQISPLDISFVEALDLIRWSVPAFLTPGQNYTMVLRQLLEDIATCVNRRPRRPRICPRVVKTKTSRYDAKRAYHRERPNLTLQRLRLIDRQGWRDCAA
jgi:hypothetical protein